MAMAGVRIVYTDGTDAALAADISEGIEKLFTEHLGPAILADQQRAVPIDTGQLLATLGMEIDRSGRYLELHVGSIIDPVPYNLAVEYGFHGEEHVREYTTRTGRVIGAHDRMGNSPEQPYMRPSIYRERTP